MTAQPSRTPGWAILFGFTALTSCYLLLDPTSKRFFPWLGIFTAQFALYAVLYVLFRRGLRLTLRSVLLTAIVARAILWFSHPVLESDYYRYLWDGHVLAHGVNPYLYPPEAEELDGLETDYRFFIQWSQYRTIYPPLAQIVFWVSHAIGPDSLVVLKIVLTGFDFATGLLLASWFRRRGESSGLCFLYLLNPLVLKEIANSAHLDSIPVFFATAAVCVGRQKWLRWAALAASAASKLYALSLAPLLIRLDKKFLKHALLAAGILAALYAPFLSAGSLLFSSTSVFAQDWRYNASIYYVVERLLGSPSVARIIVGVVFAALVLLRARNMKSEEELPNACCFVIGALLLLSPVVDPWYVLWVLPFAVAERQLPWIAFSYLVGFAYAWFESPEAARYFRVSEYVVLYALLLWHWRRRRSS